MNYCENTLYQIDYLKRCKENLENEVSTMKEEKLQNKTANGKEYFYLLDGLERKSLQKHPELFQEYFQREQIKNRLSAIDHNLLVLENSLDSYIPLTPMNSWWEILKSEQNPFRSQDRQNLYRGIFYRSKSEVAIAMFLDSYQIPYKYEVEVKISESKSRYPDFCVKRPKDQNVIYWEHCGLISRETYQNDLYYKLKEYHSAGIDLWDNLILTFDQYDGGLNTDTIEKVIRLYLL